MLIILSINVGKSHIMVTTMPARVQLTSALEQTLLRQLGQRLARARQARKLSASVVAEGVGIARNTLKAAESGDASVSMGTYLRILSALGMAGDLALVAAGVDASTDVLAQRHARLEAQVAGGTRDARSLVVIPAELAKRARLTFPKDAFGKAQPW
jgi:transcriptional regulator with XRE-family HTH domain